MSEMTDETAADGRERCAEEGVRNGVSHSCCNARAHGTGHYDTYPLVHWTLK